MFKNRICLRTEASWDVDVFNDVALSGEKKRWPETVSSPDPKVQGEILWSPCVHRPSYVARRQQYL